MVAIYVLGVVAALSPPISLVSLTPSTGSASARGGSPGRAEATPLAGREAITATFHRSVIALGSDFGGGALPHHLTPFFIHPPVPGRLRWVTTSVARFDPVRLCGGVGGVSE